MFKLIAGLWSGITGMIAAIFAIAGRKATTVTAGLATFAALLIIFIACINALVQTMVGAVTAAAGALAVWFLVPVGMFIPGNFALILAGIVSGKICRAAYDLGRKKTELVVYGN